MIVLRHFIDVKTYKVKSSSEFVYRPSTFVELNSGRSMFLVEFGLGLKIADNSPVIMDFSVFDLSISIVAIICSMFGIFSAIVSILCYMFV